MYLHYETPGPAPVLAMPRYRDGVEAHRALAGDLLEGAGRSLLDFTREPCDDAVIGGARGWEARRCRWLGERGCMRLCVRDDADCLFIEGHAPERLFHDAGAVTLAARAGGREVARFVLERPGGFVLAAAVAPRTWRRPLRHAVTIELHVSACFVPAEQDRSSTDRRRLSLVLTRVGLGRQRDDAIDLDDGDPWRLCGPPEGVVPEGPYMTGRCLVCGADAYFALDVKVDVRESLACGRCGAIQRWRHLARGLLLALRARGLDVTTLDEAARAIAAQGLHVYDTFSLYPVAERLRAAGPHYVTSELYRDVTPGREVRPGHFCQDLSALSFGDACFDAVLVTDVFEHLRLDRVALREIHRVLKPGGALVFTVPHDFGRAEDDVHVRVVDPAHPERDVDEKPRVWHGDPLGGGGDGALVYRIYGRALLTALEEAGFGVFYERTSIAPLAIHRSEVFVCVTRPGRGA
jgi:SAM-dependent methyltransferase